jgi:hypothetical protein
MSSLRNAASRVLGMRTHASGGALSSNWFVTPKLALIAVSAELLLLGFALAMTPRAGAHQASLRAMEAANCMFHAPHAAHAQSGSAQARAIP